MTRLTIGHGNGHNETSLVAYVRSADVDSFSGNEVERLIGGLVKISGHRVLTARQGFADRRARDVAIITKKSHENLGELTMKASVNLPAFERVAPARTLVASFYAHPIADQVGARGIAHFALHPDAGPKALQGRDPKHPLVREHRNALALAAAHMQAAREGGYVLVFTGDLQVTENLDRPWVAKNMFADLDLEHRSIELDWIFWDKKLALVGDLAPHRLFDHTGFVATFGPA